MKLSLILWELIQIPNRNNMIQNILFTCAGRRNYLINYFKDALNGNGQIFAADQSTTAPALIDADVAINLPSITDPEYIDLLIKVIKDHDVTAVISLNDHELPILSKHRKRVEETGAKVIISDEHVIDIAFDKWKTHQFLLESGLNSPKSYIYIDEVFRDINAGELTFPLVIKPRWGSASMGINYAESLEELELLYKLNVLQLKKSGQTDVDQGIIIQEKLDGIEYGIDVLNDFDNQYIGSYAREKINMRSGETDKAISVIDSNLTKIGNRLGSKLKHKGNMDCDVFKCGAEYYVLELNPRFGGGYPFSHEAGINTPAIYIDWLNGITDISRHNKYKNDIMFSKCDRLMPIPKKK